MLSSYSSFSSESRAFDLLSNRVGYAFINPDHTIESANGIIQELSYTPDIDIVTQPVTEAFLELFGCEETLDNIMSGELSFLEIQEVNRQKEDGEVGYYDFSLYPADRANPTKGLILLVENTSSQGMLTQQLVQQRNELRLTQAELAKANKELHRLNELKSIFLSMAAHDLRSPLSVITGYADLMLDTTSPPAFEVPFVMNRVLEQSLWLNFLIDDILNLNMIEQGKLPIDLQMIDIRKPLESVINQFGPVLSTRDINIYFDAQDEPVWVSADVNRIKQIAFNLIGNSSKFMGKSGRIIISIIEDVQKEQVVIAFADNGPGISKQQQEKLFQLFYRTPDASRFDGTGLGLYIVRMLTELHKGTVSVESAVGEGTTFYIRLPLAINS
ncbi:MAG: signal transduction histidine kinase [Cellvibrionaceae bacterium]|jgi:signal transduction histidine kinase